MGGKRLTFAVGVALDEAIEATVENVPVLLVREETWLQATAARQSNRAVTYSALLFRRSS